MKTTFGKWTGWDTNELDDDELDDEDIDGISLAECREREAENAKDARMQLCVAKHAAIIGISPDKLKQLYWANGDDYNEAQFSSHQKFEQFDAFVKEMSVAFDLKGA